MTCTTSLLASAALGGVSVLALQQLYVIVQQRRATATAPKGLLGLIRANILDLQPYRCARDDYDEGILLDANENSFGSITKDDSEYVGLNRYPCPYQWQLKSLIAEYRGVKKENIFLGVGSDEAIDLLIRVFCRPGTRDNILITPPTYGMYTVCAKVNDVKVIKSPLNAEFDVQVDQLFADCDEYTKLVFLCSPGNPTAKLIPLDTIREVLQRAEDPSNKFSGMVVVDEAYVDFAGKQASACNLLEEFPRLFVLQTCSKAFGLAGIRLGMCFGSPEMVQILNNVKAPYNVNKISSKIGIEAFESIDKLNAFLKTSNAQKIWLMNKLNDMDFVERVYPSDTNFVLFRVPFAKEVYKTMADRGIVCRYRGTELHCDSCLRVTVGTPEENQKYVDLLAQVVAELSK